MTNKEFAIKVRKLVLNMIYRGKSSHIASVFSMVEILTILYNEILNVAPDDPNNPQRDRFILSKGHAGAGVYACLAIKKFFPESMLLDHYQDGSQMSGHVSHKNIPGVEFSTGSLGHGLGIACGISVANKYDDNANHNYVVMSDGELNEGSNWESFLFASHHNLDNLTAIIDRNGYQSILKTEDTLALEPLKEKFLAFNLDVHEIDGHNFDEILLAINSDSRGRPKVIIANTVKGKGVSFMENNIQWHYTPPTEEEFQKAMYEIENA